MVSRVEPAPTQAAQEISVKDLKILDIQTMSFRYRSRIVRDEEGHSHPGEEHDAVRTLTRVCTSSGVEGYCFGGSPETAAVARRLMVGSNPLDRELLWTRLRQNQRLDRGALSDRNIGVLDQALWDFAGRLAGMPVSKLIGGFRDRIPAYASGMVGDDLPGGLNSPESYADFAATCQASGYTAFKLHTWMRPHGPDVRRDVEACRAVRERVGPEMQLMLDPHHDYSRQEALYLGRELEKLDFLWMEEPMNEHSISSYVWLTQQLDLTIVGPETAEGHMHTRAEWIAHGVSDVSRYDVWLGGITPMLKAVHLCESFGVSLEVHGPGAGNLHVLGAMSIPGLYYERGLLHPFIDYEAQTPWLKEVIDPLDADGCVRVPQRPGLGEEIDWDFVRENQLTDWQ